MSDSSFPATEIVLLAGAVAGFSIGFSLSKWVTIDFLHRPVPPQTTASLPSIVAPEEEEEGKDKLSQLPDDTLRLIQSHLTIKEAIRSSTLSTKWGHLYEANSSLHFKMAHEYLSSFRIVERESELSSLKILDLKIASLPTGIFHAILSNCLNLEEFHIRDCQLPHNLSLKRSRFLPSNHSNQLKLKVFKIEDCVGVEEIYIYAPNLVHYGYLTKSNYRPKLFLSYVPKLEKLDLSIGGKSPSSYAFCELSKDLPHLAVLSLTIFGSKLEHISAKRKMCRNLRELNLNISESFGPYLMNACSILEACPLLEVFNVGIQPDSYWFSAGWMKLISWTKTIYERRPIRHFHLKEFSLSGFAGRKSEILFANFLLESAIVLERMVIVKPHGYQPATHQWMHGCFVEGFNWDGNSWTFQRLQGEAGSRRPKARLMVRKPPGFKFGQRSVHILASLCLLVAWVLLLKALRDLENALQEFEKALRDVEKSLKDLEDVLAIFMIPHKILTSLFRLLNESGLIAGKRGCSEIINWILSKLLSWSSEYSSHLSFLLACKSLRHP